MDTLSYKQRILQYT